MPKHHSAKAPRLAHVFWPLRIQLPSCAVSRERARADARQVAAGVGLGPALAPDLVAGRHRWEIAGLLLVGPVLQHGGGEEEDAVLAHPLRRPGAVVLLLEDQPLEDADVAPAVLRGPADHRPTVLEQGVLPGAVRLEALGRIEGGEGFRRDVRGQPRPRLGPEGLLVAVVGQVHDAGNLPQRPRGCQRRRDQAPWAGGLCSTSVRTKKSTTALTIADSEGTSPAVSNSCPPSNTVNNSWGTRASPRYQASSSDCRG